MKNTITLITGIAISLIAWQYDTIAGYLFLLLGSIITGYSISKIMALINFDFIKNFFTVSTIELMLIVIAFIVAFIYPLFDVYAIMKPFYSVTQITLGVIVVYTGFLLWYFLLKAVVKYLSKR